MSALGATAIVALTVAPAQAQTRPVVVLPTDRLVQLARPATVLVRTKLKAKVTTPGTPTPAVFEAFFRTDPAAQRAARAQNEKALFDALLSGMAADPARFMPGRQAEDIDVEATGSGFVIGDGTVMTNAHVVFGDAAGTAKAAVEEVIGPPSDLEDALERELDGVKFSRELLAQAVTALHSHLVAASTADGVTKTIAVERATRAGATTLAATTTKAGARYPGDDLALLSVAELHNVPTLRFAPVEPRAGEDVFVLGFPGAATFASGTDKASTLIPTLTKGVVSRTSTTEAGVPVLQVDASLAPGNSGGPVFSKTGEVVGVSVAGIASTGNFNFAIAGTRAATFASAPVAAPKDVPLLERSLRSLEAGWLRVADEDLKALEKAYPDETVVAELRAELTSRRANKEADFSPDPPRSAVLLGLSAVSAALLLAASGGSVRAWLARRRRSTAGSVGR